MFGIGWTELIVIALLLLVFVGPKQLPEMLTKVFGMVSQLRVASRDLRNQIDEEMADLRNVKTEMQRDIIAKTDKLYAEVQEADEAARDALEEIKVSGAELQDDLKKNETIAPAPDSKVSSDGEGDPD